MAKQESKTERVAGKIEATEKALGEARETVRTIEKKIKGRICSEAVGEAPYSTTQRKSDQTALADARRDVEALEAALVTLREQAEAVEIMEAREAIPRALKRLEKIGGEFDAGLAEVAGLVEDLGKRLVALSELRARFEDVRRQEFGPAWTSATGEQEIPLAPGGVSLASPVLEAMREWFGGDPRGPEVPMAFARHGGLAKLVESMRAQDAESMAEAKAEQAAKIERGPVTAQDPEPPAERKGPSTIYKPGPHGEVPWTELPDAAKRKRGLSGRVPQRVRMDSGPGIPAPMPAHEAPPPLPAA